MKTVNPTANYIVPDGLNSLRIKASSKVFDGIRMRGIEARIRAWTIVNNGGNARPPSRSDYFLEQIANTGFPWVSILAVGKKGHIYSIASCGTDAEQSPGTGMV